VSSFFLNVGSGGGLLCTGDWTVLV